jgi:uncharacterized protein (TIGR03067 family)
MLIAWFALPLLADSPRKDGDDRQALQGTWKVVSLVNDGKEVPADKIRGARLTFEGDRYTLKGGEEGFRGTFKLDASQKPRRIDTTFLAEDDREKGKAWGIYELDGKRLRITWSQESGNRPREFASKPESGTRSMVLERE